MKALFILPEFEPHTKGGICSYYRELLKSSTVSNSWDSIVFQGSAVDTRETETTWKDIPVKYLKKKYYEKYKDQFERFSIYPELQNHLASAWGIFQQVNEEKIRFDLVVTTDWGFSYVPWLINSQVPVVIHLHGSNGQIDHFEPRKGQELLSNLYIQIETVSFMEANALVTHSHQNIQFWNSFFYKEKKISLIPPIINFIKKDYKPKEISQRYGLVIGRLQYWKGVFLLCDAVRLLPDKYRSQLKIKWMGRDTVFQKEKLSTTRYLEKHYSDVWNKVIIPIGERNHHEIQDEINKASWGLVCSEWDMFNITAAEHIMHENYLICSKKAGISDFLHGIPGVSLFDTNPKALAEAIINILNTEQETLSILAKQGKEIFKNRMDSNSILNNHKNLFENVLENHKVNINHTSYLGWLRPEIKNEDTIFSTLDSFSLKLITKYSYKRIIREILKKVKIQ